MSMIRRARRQLALFVATLVASSTVAESISAQEGGIAIGARAPSIARLEALDGTPFLLDTVVGSRPVLIEFWATWCPLCRKLEPALNAAKARYGDRVTFLGIGVADNQTPERQRQFVEERKLAGTFLFDRQGVALKAYQVPHTSYVVVLDQKGTVVYTGVGGDQDLEAAIGKALSAR